MVIVFFGTPEFAVPTLAALLDSPHRVCGVVSQPDRPRGRGQHVSPPPVKMRALAHGLPVIQPVRIGDPEVAATLRQWAPDLGVVVAYGRILPASLLALPPHGMINVHASLLPNYRGAAPVHRAVIDGQTQTGVTIMRMTEALDAGRLLARQARPIGPDETSDVIERDLSVLGAQLLVDVVDRLAAGPIDEEPQDDMLSTYAPKLTAADGAVDWRLPASYIHNRVRGLFPWPHAHTFLDGARIKIWRTHVVPGVSDAEPGTVIRADRDILHVAAGHGGIIALDELQAEGRRPMATREFLAGRPIDRGSRFGPP